MAEAPKISIVIPTHNRRALLQETIASILAQTVTSWELIVIDDASDDDTSSCISRLGDPRVRVVRLEQHSERSAARNIGLEQAKGEFVLFFDDDDLLAKSALAIHLEAFKRYPAAIASVGSYLHFDVHGTHETFRLVRRRCLRNIWPELLMSWCPTCGQCLFRTAAVRAVQGWNTSYNIVEDRELWFRLSPRGPVVLMPEVIQHYRVHAGQWRPPQRKVRRLTAEMRERAVRKLEGRERAAAERILAAQQVRQQAAAQYRNAEPFAALRSYFKVIRLMPSLLASPVLRPKLVTAMWRCMLGGPAVVAAWRRLSRRKAVDLSSRVVVRSSNGRTHLGSETPALAQNEDEE